MDLEVLKDIPGYKAILKSVLKSQIQLLIEQLSEHTGEETIILTASLHDGSLSHLGSSTGKGFLEGRDEIKSQFLGYCLKSQHKKKTSEARSSPYQRPTSDQGISQKRPRTQTVPFCHAGMGADAFSPPEMLRAPSLTTNGQTDSSANVKQETSEQNTSKKKNNSFVTESVSFPSSLQLSHTQTSADDSCDTNEHPANDTEYPEQESENDDNTATSIKIEPITENEMELEITGIEPGKSSSDPEIWGQGQSVSASSVGDPAAGNEGDQSGYKRQNPSLSGERYSDKSKVRNDQSKKRRKTELPYIGKADRFCGGALRDMLHDEPRSPQDSLNDKSNSKPQELGEGRVQLPSAVRVKEEPKDDFFPSYDIESPLVVRVKQEPRDDFNEFHMNIEHGHLETRVQHGRFDGNFWREKRHKDLASTVQDYASVANKDQQVKVKEENEWHRTVVVGQPKTLSSNQTRKIKDERRKEKARSHHKKKHKKSHPDSQVTTTSHERKQSSHSQSGTVLNKQRTSQSGTVLDKQGTSQSGTVSNMQRTSGTVLDKQQTNQSGTVSNKQWTSQSGTVLDKQGTSQSGTVSDKQGTSQSGTVSNKQRTRSDSTAGGRLFQQVLNAALSHKHEHGVRAASPRSREWNQKCQYCKLSFNSEMAMKLHMYRHNSELPYHCEFCFQGFVKEKQLRQHKEKEH